MSRHKKTGFTLIELLVVISIIALLIAILMPALNKARKQAKSTVCRMHMKQWHVVSMQYGMDHNAKFPGPHYGADGHWWMQPLRSYYSDPDIRLCPSAELPPDESGWGTNLRPPNQCWASRNPYPELEKGEVIYGSLGPNGWLMDISDYPAYGAMEGYSWENLDQVAPEVPLFLDSYWVDGWPLENDVPQENPNDVSTWDFKHNQMQKFNVDRHDGHVSAVFMNGSCELVGLKGLWRLKWHQKYNIRNKTTRPGYVWPEWMKDMPE